MLPSWCQGCHLDAKVHHLFYAADATMRSSVMPIEQRSTSMFPPGFLMADSINMPWVWWFSYPSYPSPQTPSTWNTISKHHAYNKSFSKEKSTFSRACQLWLPCIPYSDCGIANSRQTEWKRRPVNNFPFMNSCLNVNCYLAVHERWDCTFHYCLDCPVFSSKKLGFQRTMPSASKLFCSKGCLGTITCAQVTMTDFSLLQLKCFTSNLLLDRMPISAIINLKLMLSSLLVFASPPEDQVRQLSQERVSISMY